MKNTFLFAALAALTIAACSDSPPTSNVPVNNVPGSYFPRTVGSTWTYTGALGYTSTVIGDTTLGGKTWTVYDEGTGTDIARFENGSYYAAELDDPNNQFLFLKENVPVGTSWSFKRFNGFDSSLYKIEIAGVGLTRVVEGKTYTDVINVKQETYVDVQGNIVPVADNWFYAKGIGLIERSGGLNPQLRLKTYTIN